jgi:hypothetical protein
MGAGLFEYCPAGQIRQQIQQEMKTKRRSHNTGRTAGPATSGYGSLELKLTRFTDPLYLKSGQAESLSS